MRRHLSAAIVASGLVATVYAQPSPLLLDSFEGDALKPHWTVDSSKGSSVSVEPDRHVLVLQGPEHCYNHVETPFPEGAGRVQIDVCSVNDTSASWSPSLILYWDDSNYVRLMFSVFYSLKLEALADGKRFGRVEKLPVTTGKWYRGVISLSSESVEFLFGPAEVEPVQAGRIARPAAWRGRPTLIVGKGYVAKDGKPDFDNNYRRGSKTKRVEFDNLVIGDPGRVTQQLAASSKQRTAGVAHDPSLLEVAFWPGVTHPATAETLWLAPGVYQRVCVVYNNPDTLNPARDLVLELRLPDGLALHEVTLGSVPVTVEAKRSDNGCDCTIHPQGYAIPADFHGTDPKDASRPGWFNWPTSAKTPPFYIHCTAAAKADGKSVRVRASCHSGASPWRGMTVRVTEPLPALRSAKERDLGLSLWQGVMVHASADRGVVAAKMMALCKRLGVRRIHTNKNCREAVVNAARSYGIQPFLASWWHYAWQNTQSFAPTDEEKATNGRGAGRDFCPVVIGKGSGTYEKFLQTVTDKMRETGCAGFMLDYECAMPLCYCARCERAFREYAGLKEVEWPGDVNKGGRLYRQWIGFRCHQGARYVRSIRDAARRAVPDCPMQAWVAGYDYNNTIERATIDVSTTAEFLTEPETPHYTLPADYRDMWTEGAGLGSVEAGIKTVEDTLRVVRKPVIFCSSIIYPLGNKTPWSDPQILDAQIQAIIAAGARGVSFWGGHFGGGLDGRYARKFVKWHNLLAATGDFLWDGTRDDALALSSDDDANTLRRYAWSLDDRCLLALINLSQQDRTVTASVSGCHTNAKTVPGGAPVDLRKPVVIPALDGVFVVAGRKPGGVK